VFGASRRADCNRCASHDEARSWSGRLVAARRPENEPVARTSLHFPESSRVRNSQPDYGRGGYLYQPPPLHRLPLHPRYDKDRHGPQHTTSQPHHTTRPTSKQPCRAGPTRRASAFSSRSAKSTRSKGSPGLRSGVRRVWKRTACPRSRPFLPPPPLARAPANLRLQPAIRQAPSRSASQC